MKIFMKLLDLFSKWRLSKVNLNLKFAELEVCPNESDEKVEWEMYVELITRITTQELRDDTGVEISVLEACSKCFK
jgi:hypothetical protein